MPPDGSKNGLLRYLYEAGLVPVYVIAVFHSMALQISTPKLLVYVQHMGWQDGYYIAAYVAGVLVPVVVNPIATWMLSKKGVRWTLILWECVGVVGYMVMVAVAENIGFVGGWALSQVLLSLRSVRQAAVAKHTPDMTIRTSAMALHSFTNPLGSLIGSLVSRLIDAACDLCSTTVYKGIKINDYTIAFLSSGGVLAATILLSVFTVGSVKKQTEVATVEDPVQSEEEATEDDVESTILPTLGSNRLNDNSGAESCAGTDMEGHRNVMVTYVDGRTGESYVTTPEKFVKKQSLFFWLVVALVNFSSGFYSVTFQPILVNDLGFGNSGVSNIFIITTAASLIPAVTAIPLTKIFSDRTIMISGLLLKLIGMLLYSFPPINQYRIIIGFVFIQKATFFFFTCLISLFTKTLRHRCGQPLGYLLSITALTNLIASVVGGTFVNDLTGTYYMPLLSLPVCFAILLLGFPFAELDPKSAIVEKIASIKT
eukprot:TRINITY_DN6041_c0_g1_i1.p1 TRINITY_DN6041_c0_g1~~TRINITY_DN6041_c0_g1_i1.p1  ORF type:complete len:484 (+),score=62.06 TRINITY_DN6041_c0_g1_i1:54-1505(+)